ncbi:uncharacterized protein LOC119067692 isoform X1 [Bradysia coprophila]|uniref:uncharacterized protein LOC119067692 isoform X1 n=1 Tax=Bradysia coprophila TaxID=38358 RepID=UPI00187DC7FA|nr:uncharacterized protein LOC119067692 isoform X1 [Bradysia coprophila]
MALQEIVCKKLVMRTENKVLTRIYQAGVNSQEFSRATRMEDIETICVASVCSDVMQYTAELTNRKKKLRSIAFSELGYIWSGILFVFKQQVTVLYDETLRQTHFTMEYFKRSQTVITMWQKSKPSSLAKKNRSRKNSDPIEHLPAKRVRFSHVEFDWQFPDDNGVDDESTIKILQSSKVMTREQISIREVISEPLPDDLTECDGFEAAESCSTQNFLEIRDLVAQGRSIVNAIQSERVSMMAADGDPYEEDDYYAPMSPQPLSPLPQPPLSDIERCNEELDVYIPDQDENVEMNIQRAESASSDGIQLAPLPRRLLLGRRANKGKSRRRLFDDFIQIRHECDKETGRKLMRCTDSRSDSITQEYIMLQLKLINFRKPAHAFRSLQPRSVMDTAAMMVGMKRVQKAKRREPDDLNMVQDFLNSNRQEGEQLEDIPLEHLQREDQARQNRKRKSSSSTYDMIDGDPQACDERLPQDEFCDLDFGYQDDDSMDIPDEAEPILEPDSICDPEPIVQPEENYEHVPEHEPNLPSVHRSPIVERQSPVIECRSPVIERRPAIVERKSPAIEHRSPVSQRQAPTTEHQQMSTPVPNVLRTQNFRLESDIIPRRVLQLLNQFITVSATNELCRSGSQVALMLNNQKNRESWGLIGVLQNLFQLWYKNVYPLGMMDLLYPEKKKLAAALAFYSIMELNSPRIGLIVIEKVENSNAIHNIAMSEKLMEFLRKGNQT